MSAHACFMEKHQVYLHNQQTLWAVLEDDAELSIVPQKDHVLINFWTKEGSMQTVCLKRHTHQRSH